MVVQFFISMCSLVVVHYSSPDHTAQSLIKYRIGCID